MQKNRRQKKQLVVVLIVVTNAYLRNDLCMRIALFSDVHANLPALQAALKSIEEQKLDAIYCLGDLVGYNIWANEVINEIRTLALRCFM